MNRRGFLGIAAASIFAPKFGRWYRQGSGLIVRDVEAETIVYTECRAEAWVITGLSPTTMTVEWLPKSGTRLTSRALWADSITGRGTKRPTLHVAETTGFRIGELVRMPPPTNLTTLHP